MLQIYLVDVYVVIGVEARKKNNTRFTKYKTNKGKKKKQF